MAGVFLAGHTLQPNISRFAHGEVTVNYEEVFRRLPLMTALDDLQEGSYYKDWLTHWKYDSYWKSYGVKEKYGQITVPAYLMSGWYDNLVHEAFRNFKGMREEGGSETARKGTSILVGPWAHGGYRMADGKTVTFGDGLDLRAVHLRWYDYWLKGIQNGIDREAPIRIFVMGDDRWRDEKEWPLARTEWTRFYLSSQGSANSLHGNGRLSPQPDAPTAPTDSYRYNPHDPVPTLGGQISTHGELKGPQRPPSGAAKGRRAGVYEPAPGAGPTEVTGPVELRLYAASTARDTDFTATLTDVHPDGRAIHICEGIMRASFRESLENPSLIAPGKIYEYRISLWETSTVFKAGHRIRLEVSSSNFPRYARNLNTGNRLGTSAETKIAEQTIHHGVRYPSALVLPVIPR